LPVHDLPLPLPVQLQPVTGLLEELTGQLQDEDPLQNTPVLGVAGLLSQQPL
jgi:hypothetical protein